MDVAFAGVSGVGGALRVFGRSITCVIYYQHGGVYSYHITYYVFTFTLYLKPTLTLLQLEGGKVHCLCQCTCFWGRTWFSTSVSM